MINVKFSNGSVVECSFSVIAEDTLGVIEMSEHFYLTTTDHPLSLRNGAISGPDHQYLYHQAYRFKEEVVVEGLNVRGIVDRNDLWRADDIPAHRNIQVLPAGSLLIKSADSLDSWFGVTPLEQSATNFLRQSFELVDGKFLSPKDSQRVGGVSISHDEAMQTMALERFFDEQKEAHLKDVALMSKLKLLPEISVGW